MAQKNYRYTVRFQGAFPMDMLRHDCAWPRTSMDALTIERSLDTETREYGISEVELVGQIYPTVDRWASFGNVGVDKNTIQRI